MKLSDAILLSIGIVEDDQWIWLHDEPPSGCVIGTALYSMGMKTRDLATVGIRELMYEYWPWLAVDKSLRYTKADIVGELSHRHFGGASRKELAAWIASIEPPEVGTPIMAPTEEAHVTA